MNKIKKYLVQWGTSKHNVTRPNQLFTCSIEQNFCKRPPSWDWLPEYNKNNQLLANKKRQTKLLSPDRSYHREGVQHCKCNNILMYRYLNRHTYYFLKTKRKLYLFVFDHDISQYFLKIPFHPQISFLLMLIHCTRQENARAKRALCCFHDQKRGCKGDF